MGSQKFLYFLKENVKGKGENEKNKGRRCSHLWSFSSAWGMNLIFFPDKYVTPPPLFYF